ncbi:MAG: hypothetical protein H6623_09115 [Bdellovibrionaceae bacterium]|nr:hypothetical protein [Pseudobdellovibrionaceae bacterium]
MTKKYFSLVALGLLVLLFASENRSQRVDLQSVSKNWRKLSEQDVQNWTKHIGRSLSDDEYAHMLWVAKTARFLRGGKALNKSDNPNQFVHMTREQVVDYFIKNVDFFDAILDFNIYFFGFSLDAIKTDGKYDYSIFDHSAALASAVEVAHGGDYFALLNPYPEMILQPLSDVSDDVLSSFPFGSEDDKEKFKNLNSMERRHFIVNLIVPKIQNIIDQINAKTTTVKQACDDFSNLNPYSMVYAFGFHMSQAVLNNLQVPYYQTCFSDPMPADVALFAAPKALVDYIKELEPLFETLDAANYQVHSLKDMHKAPATMKEPLLFSNFTYALPLANSSTNYNRKRAAYVLSKFFCDDLTPINVETPTDHTGGAHGSDPSCYACHYKLDPMAGFFRDYGAFFTDYSQKDEILFDDQAKQNKDDYQKAWLADVSLGKKWNVGYIRSEKDPALNDYGESLEDLFNIIKNSYEYKRCVVKRLFKYATDGDQVMDAGYIEDISHQFEQTAKSNSAQAITDLFRTVVLSKTFTEEQRDPQTCYDLDPKTAISSLPCQVRYVIEQNCTKCHDNTLSLSGLDLTSWTELSPGEFGFYHVDDLGIPLPRKESFNRILDRITTSDPKKRMPKKMSMDPAHREQLFKWLNEELQK